MKATSFFATASVLAIAAGIASAGAGQPRSAAKSPSKHFTSRLPRPGSRLLYSQAAGSDSGGIVSQNFTSNTFSGGYNSEGADDFVISGSAKHKITAVFANGSYFGFPGPADSVNVVFYKNLKGYGTVLKYCTSESYTDLSGTGAFMIDVSNCGVTIKGGQHRWVSAQVNMRWPKEGEWYWRTNINRLRKASQWQNPGGSFGNVCDIWTRTQSCCNSDICQPSGSVGPDFAFAIYGK